MPAKGISKKAVEAWLKKRKHGGPVFNKKGTRVPGMFQDGGTNRRRQTPLGGFQPHQTLYEKYTDAGIEIPWGHKDSDDETIKKLYEQQYKSLQDENLRNKLKDPDVSIKEQKLIDEQAYIDKFGPINPKTIDPSTGEPFIRNIEGLNPTDTGYNPYKKSTSDIFMQKRGGQKRKAGGAVFNRNGVKVPGMRKGR
jgi:hypothetical protein